MKKLQIPHVGMRTIKTAVAVAISYFIFESLGLLYVDSYGGVWGHIGPAYACIACVICMQSSLGQSIELGLTRLAGIAVGGSLSVLTLVLEGYLTYPLFKALMLGLTCVASIWVCMLIKKPNACVMACIVPCVILINDTSGIDRFYYGAARILETVLGVGVALGVNALLPNHHAGPEEGEGK